MAAEDVFRFAVTVPAGTTIANPQVTLTQFRQSIVERVSWRIPPGHMGLTGLQISMRGVQVIPKAAGQFIVGDAEQGSLDLAGYPDSGDWSVTAYNIGTVPHTFYVTFHIQTLRPEPAAFALFDPRELGELDGRFAPAND